MAYTLKQALGYVQCRLYFLGEMRRKKEIGVVSASTSKVFRKDDPVHITAHRGFSGIAPENSLPAFERACEHDYYAIECDVHLTKDGQWIICHNSTIDKTCNAKGNISRENSLHFAENLAISDNEFRLSVQYRKSF